MKRVATALVLAPTVTWVALGAPGWLFTLFVAAIGLIAFYEFDRIAETQGLTPAGLPGVVAGIVLMVSPEPVLAAIATCLAALLYALREEDFKRSLPGAGVFLLGVIYIFGAWRCAVELRSIDKHWLIVALLVSWAGDTAAMYVGKLIGKHKLAPRVSPGKTWEGAIASVIAGTLVAGGYALYFIPSASRVLVFAIAAIANIAGQYGDLCESAFKRGANMKDSGSTIPGHGGVLDRIDSCLFSIPAVYLVLKSLP